MHIRYSVCIHEAGHYQMAKLFGHEVESVEINIDKVTNETKGAIRPGAVHSLAETKERGSYWRVNDFFRCIPFDSGGLIAEYLHSGKGDFWKKYSPKNLTDSQDFWSLKERRREEGISKEEMEVLLKTTANLLSLPTIWKSVLHMSEKLNTDTNKYGAAGIYATSLFELAKRGVPTKPTYHADELIEFLITVIYE